MFVFAGQQEQHRPQRGLCFYSLGDFPLMLPPYLHLNSHTVPSVLCSSSTTDREREEEAEEEAVRVRCKGEKIEGSTESASKTNESK